MRARVAFQGEHGAYSEAATLEHFGRDAEPCPAHSFEAAFEAVESSACEYGMLPIENSLAGSIHHNYDLLLRHQLWVVGEHYLHVHHCLIGLPGASITDIRKVISHPQALAQCDGYLSRLDGVAVEPSYDTAGSVKIISQQKDPGIAAIASRLAAELYGMQVLAEGIQDDEANITRFLVVGRQPTQPGDNAKTTIVFALKNHPGALFKALSVFALRDIDLAKIESRPLVGKPWEYLFYVDFAGSTEEETVSRALGHLGEYATFLRVLGSYPRQNGIT